MVVKEAQQKGAPKKAVEIRQVPIAAIFNAEFEALNIPESEHRRITNAYEQYTTDLMNSVKVWMDGNKVTDINKTDERKLFSFLLDVFRKDFKASDDEDGQRMLITSIEDNKFNCYSSSVLLGDVLTRLGKPITAIIHGVARIPEAHVLLAGQEYVLETTSKMAALGVYPKSELGNKYPLRQEMGIETLLSITYDWCGSTLGKMGRYDEALSAYDKALGLNPQDAVAWYNKGVMFHKMGRLDEALASCNKALELNTEYAAAWNNKGVMLHKIGRYAEALSAYDKALELGPKDAEVWYNKGLALGQMGRHDEAEACIRKALELEEQKE